jgi:hypothetical protein
MIAADQSAVIVEPGLRAPGASDSYRAAVYREWENAVRAAVELEAEGGASPELQGRLRELQRQALQLARAERP